MEEKKPDLTNFKNIFNYVVYGLAAIVSLLYFNGTSKDDKIYETINASLKICQEDNKRFQLNNQRLIDRAYNLEQTNAQKDTMLIRSAEAFDSISLQKLKQQAGPYIQKIKKFNQ